MKTTRIPAMVLAMSLLLISLPSCLKNQVDYFSTSAAERLQKVLSDMKDTLLAPRQGWRMEYFIGNVDQDRGGRNITMEFYPNSDSVRIKSEENKDTAITSWFKLSSDDGPVLSFDTYNELFHKYAVPSSSYYEARGGDFEFIIQSYSTEKIVLKGKRSGKISTMYPLDDSQTADEFIEKVATASKNFYVSGFKGEVNKKQVTGSFDVRNRQFTIEEVLPDDDYISEPEKETVPYIITEKGIQFYEPFKFLGETFTEMTYNKADTSFTTVGLSEGKGFIPKDWRPYEFFPGKYILNHANGSMSITVSPYGDEQDSFLVTGMSDTFDVLFGYDIRLGRMTLGAQLVAEAGKETVYREGKDYVILVPLSTNGFFGTSDEYGMSAELDENGTSPRYKWVDMGLAPRFITESFYLRLYNGGFVRDESGSSVAPRVATYKGNLTALTPISMSKFAQ